VEKVRLKIEFVTPCFLGGADAGEGTPEAPSEPEWNAKAIRGQPPEGPVTSREQELPLRFPNNHWPATNRIFFAPLSTLPRGRGSW